MVLSRQLFPSPNSLMGNVPRLGMRRPFPDQPTVSFGVIGAGEARHPLANPTEAGSGVAVKP